MGDWDRLTIVLFFGAFYVGCRVSSFADIMDIFGTRTVHEFPERSFGSFMTMEEHDPLRTAGQLDDEIFHFAQRVTSCGLNLKDPPQLLRFDFLTVVLSCVTFHRHLPKPHHIFGNRVAFHMENLAQLIPWKASLP